MAITNRSAVNDLKRKIIYEDERINEVFADIGKKFYKNPNAEWSEFQFLCEDVDARRRRIKNMLFELGSLRGYKRCPNCDAEIRSKFLYCGMCGAKLPTDEDDDLGEKLKDESYYDSEDE
jgi:hypothetical protein